jgi:hypothetical protein
MIRCRQWCCPDTPVLCRCCLTARKFAGSLLTVRIIAQETSLLSTPVAVVTAWYSQCLGGLCARAKDMPFIVRLKKRMDYFALLWCEPRMLALRHVRNDHGTGPRRYRFWRVLARRETFVLPRRSMPASSPPRYSCHWKQMCWAGGYHAVVRRNADAARTLSYAIPWGRYAQSGCCYERVAKLPVCGECVIPDDNGCRSDLRGAIENT